MEVMFTAAVLEAVPVYFFHRVFYIQDSLLFHLHTSSSLKLETVVHIAVDEN